MKELLIDKQNELALSIEDLEKNTEELASKEFEEGVDLDGVKGVLSELVKLVKEIKEFVLI